MRLASSPTETVGVKKWGLESANSQSSCNKALLPLSLLRFPENYKWNEQFNPPQMCFLECTHTHAHIGSCLFPFLVGDNDGGPPGTAAGPTDRLTMG